MGSAARASLLAVDESHTAVTRRPHRRSAAATESSGGLGAGSATVRYLLSLQREAGNEAVESLLASWPRVDGRAKPAAPSHASSVQRCGSMPCDCPDEAAIDPSETPLGLLPAQRADDEWAASGSEWTSSSGAGSQWSSSSSAGQGFSSGQNQSAVPEGVAVEEPVESPDEATGPGAEFFAVDSPGGGPASQAPAPGASAAPGPDGGCHYFPGEKERTKTEGVGAFGLTVPPPDIFGQSTTLVEDTFGIFGFTQGDDRLKELHEEFLQDEVGKLGLDTEDPTHRVVKVEGFSDCVDSFSKNIGIRLRRAQKTRQALLDFGALESNISSIAVASAEGASLTESQKTEQDRANNRAAVCHVELVGRPRPERSTLPDVFDPSCDKPSDRWAVGSRTQVAAGTLIGPMPAGGSVFTFKVTNLQTGCEHFAVFLGGGFSTPGVSLSVSTPAPPETHGTGEFGDVFARELSGFGFVHFVSAGVEPAGLQIGALHMMSGAFEGQEIDIGGFQFFGAVGKKKPDKVIGFDAQVIAGRLQVFDSALPEP